MNQSLSCGKCTNRHFLLKSLILLIILLVEIPLNTWAQNTSYSLKFDGIDDYVQLSENLTIGTSSNTIEFWVKVPVTGTNNLVAGERVGILLGNFDDDPNSGWEIHDDGQMRLWWNDEELDVFGTTDLRDNKWHHIAFVRDKGNTILFYVDGVHEILSYQDGSGSGSDITFTTTHRIGADNRSTGIPYFHGQINEMRIWNTALSQSEIQNNMYAQLSGSESNLVAHYKMDEASGTTLTDNSGSNTGTLNGVTWFNNPPEIEGNNTSPNYREGDSDIQLFPALTISDVENDNIDGMKIYFSSGYYPDEDTLKFTDTPDILGSFNEETGVLTLSGVDSPAAYQTAVRSITYYNTYSNDAGKSATEGQRKMGVSIGGSAYSFETGHYYEFVDANLTWINAKSEAESRYLYGMQGYLATVTSQNENDFIQEKLAADGWLGGSDQAADDVWIWETGPETDTQFWQGEENGNTVGGNYANWNSGEPNESGGNEDYLQIYSSGTNPGKWNDESSTLQLGYVVEYGGMSNGDVNLYTSTTLDVLANTPPVANDTTYFRYYTNTSLSYSVNTPGILDNDYDVEDDNLTAELIDDVANGTLTLNADGSFNYIPENDWTGSDQFTYRAFDGIDYSAPATVTITVVVPKFTGGGANENFSNPDNWNTGYAPNEPNLDIIIASEVNMIVDQNYSCKNLQFEMGSSFNCTEGNVLTITEGVLDASGKVAIDVASSLEVRSSIEIPQPAAPPQ